MGYSGTPMVTVRNNRNLISKRNKLFKLDGIAMKVGGQSRLNKKKFDNTSSYDQIQKEKRTTVMLSKRRLAKIRKDIFSLFLTLSLFIITYYILTNVK